ncbi:MAG: hypothetical protein M1834_007128 [Cirrosporium novae-zelandiae]|nr:MAG: hypothetical protein M1834_007128 [Cirrosporium novae-zelandiae]
MHPTSLPWVLLDLVKTVVEKYDRVFAIQLVQTSKLYKILYLSTSGQESRRRSMGLDGIYTGISAANSLSIAKAMKTTPLSSLYLVPNIGSVKNIAKTPDTYKTTDVLQLRAVEAYPNSSYTSNFYSNKQASSQ